MTLSIGSEDMLGDTLGTGSEDMLGDTGYW